MLRKAIFVRIFTYCQDDGDTISMVENHLFDALNKIELSCQDYDIEWCLDSEGRAEKHMSGMKSGMKRFEWRFVMSAETLNAITRMFDDIEDFNLTSYYFEIRE